MSRKKYLFIVLFLFSVRFGYAILENKSLEWQDEGIAIRLKEHLKIPGMSWPNTLLEYPVDFSSETVNLQELVLVDQNEKVIVPFQFTKVKQTNGKISSAVLCFFSDLTSGGQKEFRLTKQRLLPHPYMDAQSRKFQVDITRGETILVNNGLIRIALPTQGKQIAPIRGIKIGDAENWYGEALFPDIPLERFAVEEKEAGPLLAEYELDIRYSRKRSYRLTLKIIAGTDYVEMKEEMSGFNVEDSLSWQIEWQNFSPQYKYIPNRPAFDAKNQKGYEGYAWETIEGTPGNPDALIHPEKPYDQQLLSNGLLPVKIAPYHNWLTWWRTNTAAFWNEQTGRSIGVFIKNFEDWVDPAYPIWGNKDNLSIHFFYKDNRFWWSYPLVTGKRSSAITLYPHQKDKEMVNASQYPALYVDSLRKWQGWISLNKVKDWILDYGSDKSPHPVFITDNRPGDKKRLFQRMIDRNQYFGIRTNYERANPIPVQTRAFFELAVLLEQAEPLLTLEEYRQARAIFLFNAYTCMDEALMPMMNMLSGHPNFLADNKSVPAVAAFMFPDHPHAQRMVDYYEKSVALNLRYHTRPDEPAWNAKGGRWTENMACYTWAFLRPTIMASFLLHHYYDGKNRILQPNISQYAGWLLNGLTTPLNIEGGKRGMPPQGAHVRLNVPPNYLYILGEELSYYDPLLSEHLSWVSSPSNPHFESNGNWENAMMSHFKHSGGTNPHLRSAKYTGYGLILRSDFGKPDEMYVHLQQIDAGPNYRWGRAAKGGNGIIYYNACGKRYSHNGLEDVGDAPFGDTERCTNFGVKKAGSYRCIGDYRSVGMNELTDPLYDFGFAQFASVRANEEAAPEYISRSVLMSDNDYILILDDVKGHTVEGRLSWFVGKDEDFPYIHQLIPGISGKDAGIQPSSTPYHKDPESLPTKGRYYDGRGDFLTLVTHRKEINPVADDGFYRIAKPDGSQEWVFRSDENVHFNEKQLQFEGKAGLIRQYQDGKRFEAALFQGHKIGIPGITVEWSVAPQEGGLSLKKQVSGFSGIFQLQEAGVVQITLDKKRSREMIFYLNGKPTNLTPSGKNTYTLSIPAGKHDWQWTDKGVIPGQAVILKSVAGASHCLLEWTPVTGATSYRIEKSVDGGNTWDTVTEKVTETQYRLSGLTEGTKIHVRVTTMGNGGSGEPSDEYPVYPGKAKPHAPEGLRAVCTGNEVALSWGQILGADQYTLYQRKKGTSGFRKVYFGDQRTAVVKLPGSDVFEFTVTATNENGESDQSILADTDANRLINWYPIPGEIFRRDTESHENGYVEYNHWIEQQMPVLSYPFQHK
ncbi:MAG: fibronectin type III domain-containing protein [Tannerellaceae bacterium]|jgi:hypothetical protein|nr:fibronectin type III domain-containing protein [Tannerellaceae bacterium]